MPDICIFTPVPQSGINNTSMGKAVYIPAPPRLAPPRVGAGDDLQVIHRKYHLAEPIQLDDYYPFGLQTGDSWVADNTTPNTYLFNAGSEKNSTTGNYQTFFRDYDPALGRMTGIDLMAGKYSSVSPYNYAFNDPIGLNDPSGADPYLPRYQEDWGSGTIMDQGPIADPEYLANSFWAVDRADLWGIGHITPGSEGDWGNEVRGVRANMAVMSSSAFAGYYGLDKMTDGQKAAFARSVGSTYSTSNLSADEMQLLANALTYGKVVLGVDGRLDITTVAIVENGGPGQLTPYSFQLVKAQNGGNDGNLLGDASTYLGVASSALLLSDEFRATSTGKYVHVNGATYKIGFRGNQHLSKYTVQASKINTASTARFVGKISNALVLVGAGVTVYDGISNGWENHHTADLLVTGGFYALAVSIPVAGWIAGGVYLAADLTTQYYTGKSITENIFD